MEPAARASVAPVVWRLALAVLVTGLVVAFERSAAGRAVDAWLYDHLLATAPLEPTEPAVAIVAIDAPSFAEIGLQWPWPRSLHARLVDALRGAGAAVVVLDMVLAEPSTPDEDTALADAIRRVGAVVLASDEAEVEDGYVESRMRIDPLKLFLDAGARSGDASVALDPDGVVRLLPAGAESLGSVALAAAAKRIPGPPPPAGALLRYPLPVHGPPRIAYYQALDPPRFLPPDLLRGKIVVVGLELRQSPEIGGMAPDTFLTPMTRSYGRLSFGAAIQAAAIENLATGAWIAPTDRRVPVAMAAVAALLAALVLHRYTAPRAIGLLVGTGALAIGAAILLLRQGHWLSPLSPTLAVAAIVLGEGARALVVERRARRQVRDAFARYVSPAYVDQLARDPKRLSLGGETREMTFLFCDIRGFTGISETLQRDPQRLTRLINRFLTAMTTAIHKHQGTIDKFIGDCVMAFWNAPLDDPDHAAHACEAALAMLRALDALNEQLAREGETLAPLRIGIGINTGTAVVGNVGSQSRFAYSVLGDAVNLAARLEPLGQRWGLPIVIGDATAKAVAGRFAVLELDRIHVKGKSEPVRVHALAGDATMAADKSFAEVASLCERLHVAQERGRTEQVAELREALRRHPLAPAALVDGLRQSSPLG